MQVMRIIERIRHDLQRFIDFVPFAGPAQAEANRTGRVAHRSAFDVEDGLL